MYPRLSVAFRSDYDARECAGGGNRTTPRLLATPGPRSPLSRDADSPEAGKHRLTARHSGGILAGVEVTAGVCWSGRLFACAVVTSLAVVLGTLPALAAPEANERIDITPLFEVNECTGEPVVVDGRVHILVDVTPNTDGSFRIKVHTNTQGVSATGVVTEDTYSFNEATNLNGEFDVPAGGSAHFRGHEELIHHGESGGSRNQGTTDYRSPLEGEVEERRKVSSSAV